MFFVEYSEQINSLLANSSIQKAKCGKDLRSDDHIQADSVMRHLGLDTKKEVTQIYRQTHDVAKFIGYCTEYHPQCCDDHRNAKIEDFLKYYQITQIEPFEYFHADVAQKYNHLSAQPQYITFERYGDDEMQINNREHVYRISKMIYNSQNELHRMEAYRISDGTPFVLLIHNIQTFEERFSIFVHNIRYSPFPKLGEERFLWFNWMVTVVKDNENLKVENLKVIHDFEIWKHRGILTPQQQRREVIEMGSILFKKMYKTNLDVSNSSETKPGWFHPLHDILLNMMNGKYYALKEVLDELRKC